MPIDPEVTQLTKDYKNKYSEVISLIESIFQLNSSLQRQGDVKRDLSYLQHRGIITNEIYNVMNGLYPPVVEPAYTREQLQGYIQQLQGIEPAVQQIINTYNGNNAAELEQLNKDFRNHYMQIVPLVESIFDLDHSLSKQGDFKSDLKYLKSKSIIGSSIYDPMYALYIADNNNSYSREQLVDYNNQLNAANTAVQAVIAGYRH